MHHYITALKTTRLTTNSLQYSTLPPCRKTICHHPLNTTAEHMSNLGPAQDNHSHSRLRKNVKCFKSFRLHWTQLWPYTKGLNWFACFSAEGYYHTVFGPFKTGLNAHRAWRSRVRKRCYRHHADKLIQSEYGYSLSSRRIPAKQCTHKQTPPFHHTVVTELLTEH